MKRLLAAATLTVLALGTATAGQLTDEATHHFQAIASGNVTALMNDYANHAQLNWVGGPLDGTYNGTENIRTVWGKFTKAVGPLKVNVDKLEEAANPKGATVTANVQFEGKQTIKVRYVLTYRENKLVSETWQIDPKLAVSGY